MPSFEQILNAKAIQIGKLSVRATTSAGSGHPSTALSLAHLTAALMYATMRWDPENPHYAGSDRLVLSEGHAVPIIYAAFADIGVTIYKDGKAHLMDDNDLLSLRAIDSPIDGHPNPVCGVPFFDAATGSLGQGLSVAAGLGAAARMDKIDKLIYCIIGDGESREGQIWEAMDFVADHQLTNVIAIFNCNLIAQSDYVSKAAQSPDALAAKAAAFGWKVVTIDGHNPTEIRDALAQQKEAAVEGKPLCIIARTVKGWGAASQQGLGHHGHPVSAKDLDNVLAELDKTAEELKANNLPEDAMERALRIRPPLKAPEIKKATKPLTYSQAVEKAKLTESAKKKLAPRRAFGLALDALGATNPNVVGLDADVKNSTFAQDFAKNHPANFLECRIAEQNMVSVAAGCCAAGKIAFCSTFGKFFVRAFDQIEMGIISGAAIKLVGTHIGVTLASDGPSQMAIADVAFLRAIAHAKDHRGNPACTILTPSDPVSAYNMVLEMADWPGAVYLRALRADMAPLYEETETFPFGGYKVVKRSSGTGKKLVIAASGFMVQSSLSVAKKLAEQGIDAAVVDAYCLPIHTAELLRYIEEHGGTVLTVEDNYVGGLGSELAEAAAKHGKVKVLSMNVHRVPKSGKTPEDVLAYCHLSETDILHAAVAAAK